MNRTIQLSLLLALLLTLVSASLSLAQDKTLYWQRYDVNLTVQENSDMLVEEIQEIVFTSGTFRFGFAAIPLERVEQITDVSVSEITADGQERAYRRGSGDEPYTFTTQQQEGDLEISWYFPPTSNSQHTYILRYRVIGGLRIYEGGDQVWWKAIPPDHNFRIGSATVTVTPPATFRKSELTVQSYGAETEQINYTDRGAVVFEARDIPANEALEVRVEFPPGAVQAEPPAWQAAFDRRQSWGPVISVLAGGLGLILLIGGPVGIYLLWYTRGRDEEAATVPEVVSEPPSELPAGIVGTLVDEKAEMKDIIASILDLAQRGALRMDEKQQATLLGFGVSREFIFHKVDPQQARFAHEERLLERIFGPKEQRRLRELRQKFYSAIPKLQEDLYEEVVKQGYFVRSPDRVRRNWLGLSLAGLVISVGLTFGSLFFLGDYSVAAACPGLGLIFTMLSLLVVSRHMPRKTARGVEEAAKWLAFKRYLEELDQKQDLEAAKDRFETFLPYAVAFGLEQRLIRRFASVEAPAPSWWGPVMMPHHGPHYGGGRPGQPAEAGGGPPGPLAEAGGGASLSDMSDSIGGSLATMSDSLGSLLNSAGQTLSSTPPSSSGSGGFSGGGFSGGGSFGGGGGGGSRGFG